MRIKYCGPARDYSGYGEANRHDIAALIEAGIDVTGQFPSYTLEISDYGRLGEMMNKIEGKELGYKIKILHTTPNVYKQYFEGGCYHIGRVFWETDKLPLDFAINVQLCDEIWTGSEFNKKAIINAGVTRPIYVIPEAIDSEIDVEKVDPYVIEHKNTYKFYSIFEWTERKNPAALLEAYWREFEMDEGVSLTLKTYLDNFTPAKKQEINNMIRMIKKKLNLKRFAPVYLYRNLMDRHQVYRFHKTFDCFVSAHRGEGWGVPQMEAMLMKKPIISTNCGGIHEYLTDGQDALLVPYTMIPVENSRNVQWYTPDQKWADIHIDKLREAMRFCFDNREKATEIGINGNNTVNSKFSLKAVGMKMQDRLEFLKHEMEPNYQSR